MKTVTLGRTGITVPKNGFGALPIQRISAEEAGKLLRKAYDHGIRFFDTARAYSDSEEKIGLALSDVRDDIFLATKTGAQNAEGFWKDLETSLRLLKTDHVDLYQFHNPAFCPKPGDESGLYDAALKAKEQGKLRFIGITNHRQHVAKEAVESGLYDTLQFPFCYLASEQDLELVNSCKEENMGFIAMKALSGGLITNSRAAYAFQDRFDHVIPIWGVQHEWELDEFLSYSEAPPVLDEELQRVIEADKESLKGNFCRSCGYCMPCTVGIQINQCARMAQLIRRSPKEGCLTQEMQAMMKKIEECVECGVCMTRCPYELNIPELLKKNYEDYQTFLS